MDRHSIAALRALSSHILSPPEDGLTGFCPLVPCLYEFIHCTSPTSCFVPLVLVYRSPCEGEDCCEINRNSTSAPSFRRGLLQSAQNLCAIFPLFQQPARVKMKWLNLTEDERQNAIALWGENFQDSQQFWWSIGRRSESVIDIRRVRSFACPEERDDAFLVLIRGWCD